MHHFNRKFNFIRYVPPSVLGNGKLFLKFNFAPKHYHRNSMETSLWSVVAATTAAATNSGFFLFCAFDSELSRHRNRLPASMVTHWMQERKKLFLNMRKSKVKLNDRALKCERMVGGGREGNYSSLFHNLFIGYFHYSSSAAGMNRRIFR